jgi:hypothetical protein
MGRLGHLGVEVIGQAGENRLEWRQGRGRCEIGGHDAKGERGAGRTAIEAGDLEAALLQQQSGQSARPCPCRARLSWRTSWQASDLEFDALHQGQSEGGRV